MDNIKDKTDIAYQVFCEKHMARHPHEIKQLKALIILIITGLLSLLIL